MNKTISIGIGLALIIGVGALVLWQKNEAREEQAAMQAAEEAQAAMPETTGQTNDGTTTSSTTGESAGGVSYSSADVATHNSRTSCWSIINGGVYDLTSWIPKHPGGEQAILSMCGKDGSARFNGQHGGAKMQAQILAGFKIGVAK